MRRAAFVFVLLSVVVPARAETVLRVATVAPDGTAWAHELQAFSHDVERRSDGRVRVRYYFGSIAGGDLEVGERMRRGQLDGTASGGPLCFEAMPSMRVLEMPALFASRDEAKFVINQLGARAAREAEQSGFAYLGTTPLGGTVYLGSRPVSSLAELRQQRLWVWDAEPILVATYRAMGLDIVATPVDRAAHELAAGHFNAFLTLPTAALAFGWSARMPYIVNLRNQELFGCVLVANRAFASLSGDDQMAVRAAAAQLRDRIEEVAQREEQALLGGLFQRQGVRVLPVSDGLRVEFDRAARAARDSVGKKLLPAGLLDEVNALTARYRAEHARPHP